MKYRIKPSPYDRTFTVEGQLTQNGPWLPAMGNFQTREAAREFIDKEIATEKEAEAWRLANPIEYYP